MTANQWSGLDEELAGSAFVVADVETTGIDPNADKVVEFALVRFRAGKVMERFSGLVNPGIPIPPVASAVHMLRDCDVSGKPTIDSYAADILSFVSGLPVVAHNAGFDMGFLTMLSEKPWVCTYRLARRLWPMAPRHSNAVLRYVLGLDNKHDLSAISPHRAESDCIITGLIFVEQLRQLERLKTAQSLDDVRNIAWSPIPLTHLHVGKRWYGHPISDVPTSYLQWLYGEQTKPQPFRKITLDPDTLHTVENEIASRLFGDLFDDGPGIEELTEASLT